MLKAFINCKIDKRKEQAILVEYDRIKAMGTNEEIQAQIGATDEVIDLHGCFLMPGFVDSHMHLLEYGYYLSHVALLDCRSLEEVLERVKKEAEKQPEWVIGRGYNEDLFTEPARITRTVLDEVCSDLPVALTRCCGHKMVCNTKALQLAGIEEDSTIDGGRIDYADGLLEETALSVVQRAMPKETVASLKEAILRGAQEVNRYGITCVGSDDFLSVTKDYKLVMEAFMQLAYQRKLNVRVVEQCEFETPQDLAEFLDEGYTTGIGDDLFQIGPLKMILDGSLGARTAALRKPYTDDPETSGYLIDTKTAVTTFVKLAASYNMPTICHAIGDKATDQALKVLDSVLLPGNPLHHGLVHCQIMDEKQAAAIVERKLDCYVQSLFLDSDAKILTSRVGEKRARSSYPFRTLYEGTNVCNGSDAPVERPDALRGIELAMTRTSMDQSASMNPDQRLTLRQALDSYTINGALALGLSEEIGMIEPGKKADFVVLKEDPSQVDPLAISTIPVLMTVMDGRMVFER